MPPWRARAASSGARRFANDVEQFLQTTAPDRRDDAKLGKMRPDRVDDRWHQACFVTQCLQLARPMMGRGAGLETVARLRDELLDGEDLLLARRGADRHRK
jgi:hypothetical protein